MGEREVIEDKTSTYKYKICTLINLLIITIIIMSIWKINSDLFHFIIELSIIVLGYCIIMISINTYRISENNFLTFIGISYGFICNFYLLHLIYYSNTFIHTENYLTVSLRMAVVAKTFGVMTLLISFRYIHRKIKINLLINTYLAITILFVLLTFYYEINGFPINTIEITSITTLISKILCISLVYCITKLIKNKKLLNNETYINVIFSFVFNLFSEIVFLIKPNMMDNSNSIGHILRLICFYFMYKAIVINTLKNPMEALFNNINDKNNELENNKKELEDIVKQLKKTEKNLIKSKETYENLIEFLPVAVIIRKGRKLVFANKAAVQLLNAKGKNEIIGKDALSIIAEEQRDDVSNIIDRIDRGEKIDFIEKKFKTMNGKIKDVEMSLLQTYIDNEEFELTVVRDITEKKSNEEIQRRLKEAEESEKIRTEFFANLSHEFRTPINVIYSALQVANIYLKQGKLEEIEKYNKVIKQNCYRLLRLINNLIDITKIDAGFYKLQLKNCNIVNVIENIVMSVAAYAENNGVEIVFDTDMEEKIISCDPDIMERVILNLISNSIKNKKEKMGKIEINILQIEDQVQIHVKDDGVGIPKNKQESVFERFIQVDKSLTRKSEGSGIGLSLVKSLIELHGGTIVLNSKENEGCEFIISLPSVEGKYDDVKDMDNNINNVVEKINIEFSDIYS